MSNLDWAVGLSLTVALVILIVGITLGHNASVERRAWVRAECSEHFTTRQCDYLMLLRR